MSVITEHAQFKAPLQDQKLSGIYKITFVQDQSKFYIGSTYNNFRRRWNQHILGFSKGEGVNPKFQNAWNKYGADQFIFTILETIDKTKRQYIREREQYYVDALQPYYNTQYAIIASTDNPVRATPDKTHHFICTAPNGTEYITTNIPEFAREHGLCKESMRGVAKGRLRQYKGWLCRYTPETLTKLTPEQQAEVQANFAYQAQYPNGKPISAEDKQRIIDASRTPEALAKRGAARKGQRPNAEQLNNLSLGHCKRTFVITTPTGEEITTMQLVQFAKDLGSSHSGFYKSARTGKPHKGYTVREITPVV